MARLQDLTSEAISQLSEGVFGKVIESEMVRLTNDLEQRGMDGKSRKLCIQLEVYFDHDVKRYKIEPTCQAKLPPQKAYTTEAKMEFDPVQRGHVLQFNPDCVVPDQSTINEVIEK